MRHARALLWITASLAVGCGIDGEEPLGALPDDATSHETSTDAPDVDAADVHVDAAPDALADDGTASDVAADAEPDVEADVLLDAALDVDDGGDADADDVADAAIDAPPSCGDGIRHPTEECDDGLGTDAGVVRRTCDHACLVQEVLAVAPPASGTVPRHKLATARHPIAATTDAMVVALLEEQGSTSRVLVVPFAKNGTARDPIDVSVGLVPTATAAPSLAALPDGRFAVVFTDAFKDGDGLGVVLRTVDPATGAVGTSPGFAPASKAFGQTDPDVVWTGSELVVAWTDFASPTTSPDLKVRRFTGTLSPLGGDEILAAAAGAQGNVCLARLGSSWAAAYRVAAVGSETIHVQAAGRTFTTPSFVAGPTNTRPALVELDATHLLVVWTEKSGLDSALLGGIVDTAASSTTIASFAIEPGAAEAREPSLTRVGSTVFLSYRADNGLLDPKYEETWFKELPWSGAALDLTRAAAPLPRWTVHRDGDQRWPSLGAFGGSLVVAWEDLARTFGTGVASTEVVVQIAPIPVLRGSGG